MRGMIICGLLLLVGYLSMVNTRWGHMVDIAAYSGRNIISPALIVAVSVSTLLVAIVLSRGRRIPPLFDRGCHHLSWICLRGGWRASS